MRVIYCKTPTIKIGSICIPNYHYHFIYCHYRIDNWQDISKILKTCVHESFCYIFEIVEYALRHPLDKGDIVEQNKRGKPTIFARFNVSMVIIRHVSCNIYYILSLPYSHFDRLVMITGMIINGCAACAVHTDSDIVESLSDACKNYYYYSLYDSGLCFVISRHHHCPISCRANLCRSRNIDEYLQSTSMNMLSAVLWDLSSCISRVVAHFENSAYTANNCSICLAFGLLFS